MTSRFPFTSYPTGWFRIAGCNDLPIGKVLALRYFGRDLVLFRTEDGKAHLLDAHCPHVGAHLGYGGKVLGNTIQCPFHGWQLNGDGACVKIPYSEKIPPERTRSWPVLEVNGQILAYNDPAGREPQWRVPEFPEYASNEWSNFDNLSHWVIRTHLQDLGENGLDSAHFPFLHHQQTARMRTDAVEIDGPTFIHRTFQYYNVFGLAKLLGGEVSGPLDIYLYGLGCVMNRTVVHAKTTKLFYSFAFFFTPVDEEHVEVNAMLGMKKMPMPFATNILLRKAIREGRKTIDQDVPIWENKIYRERPRLVDNDGPIMQFRKWASQFYANS